MIQSDEKCQIVVGGGLAGLFSAYVLHKKGLKNIYVIEKSHEVGGLLQHTYFENPLGDGRDFTFDHGTHFVLGPKTGPVSELIASSLNVDEYHQFNGSLQEAHVLNGQLYLASGCATLSSLPSETQTAIYEELNDLNAQGKTKGERAQDFHSACVERYGHLATEHVYAPAYKKFTGMSCRDLPIEIGNFFAPGRLIISDRENSKKLKENPDWDWRIAYADCQDGTSDIVKYYPKKSGIGHWLGGLAEQLESLGVTILTGQTIEALQESGNKIKDVQLSDKRVLACDNLVWSLPSIFLALLTGTEVPKQKPNMRQVLTMHFLTDAMPVDRPHWITIYDPQYKSYRVTLYENFAPLYDDVARLTVEVLHDGEYAEPTEHLSEDIFAELKAMGILPKEARKLWYAASNKPNGFPVLTATQNKTIQKQNDLLEEKYANVSIVGRRPDVGGGQLAVMDYIYKALS